MNVQFQPNFRTAERRLPFECVTLVLQGGGALGAYQAGVYEALAEANITIRRGSPRSILPWTGGNSASVRHEGHPSR